MRALAWPPVGAKFFDTLLHDLHSDSHTSGMSIFRDATCGACFSITRASSDYESVTRKVTRFSRSSLCVVKNG